MASSVSTVKETGVYSAQVWALKRWTDGYTRRSYMSTAIAAVDNVWNCNAGEWNVSCEWPGCLVNSISGESVSGAEHGGPWASRQRGSCSPCAGYNYTPIRIHTVPPLFRKMWVRLPIIHLVLLIYSCTPRDFTWCMTSVLFQPRNNKGLTTVVRRLCELIRTEELRLIKVFGQSNVHDYDYEYECQY